MSQMTMTCDSSDYLMHYGVLGMKWGVRKQEKKAARYEKKADKFSRKLADVKPGRDAAKAELSDAAATKERTETKVIAEKSAVKDYQDRVDNPKKRFLFGVNKKQLKKDKAALEEARTRARTAAEEDEVAEDRLSDALEQYEFLDSYVQKYQRKKQRAIKKSEVARGKALMKKEKLQEALNKKFEKQKSKGKGK